MLGHCPVCGEDAWGEHHCDPKVLKRIEQERRRASIDQQPEKPMSFDDRLELGFMMLGDEVDD